MCWGWTCQLGTDSKTVCSTHESENVSLSNQAGKTLWCLFSVHYISSWSKQVSFLNETLSLDLLKSSSPRTPRLIIPCMLCHSTHSEPPLWWWWTAGEWSTPPLPPPPLPSWNVLVWPKCAFSVLGYCRELLSMWTYQLGSAIKITSQILWKLEYILKTHWGKHTGCWFSHHSSRFLSLSSNYSEETPCLDHLTRSSFHRTSRFIMPCLFMQLNTFRKTTSPQVHHRKVI